MFNSFYQLHAFFSGKAKQKTKKLGFVLLLSSPRAQTLLYLPNFPENQSYFKKTAITFHVILASFQQLFAFSSENKANNLNNGFFLLLTLLEPRPFVRSC